jgi:hypothetical protein
MAGQRSRGGSKYAPIVIGLVLLAVLFAGGSAPILKGGQSLLGKISTLITQAANHTHGHTLLNNLEHGTSSTPSPSTKPTSLQAPRLSVTVVLSGTSA